MVSLFDGQSLTGWQAAEHAATWRVEEGLLVAKGPRSHLFYAGPVGNADFRNFELEAEVKTGDQANSGIYFHTEYQRRAGPPKDMKCRSTTPIGRGAVPRTEEDRESLRRAQHLQVVRCGRASGFACASAWSANRIRVWVNDFPTVDYLQPENPPRSAEMAGKGCRTAPLRCRHTIRQ